MLNGHIKPVSYTHLDTDGMVSFFVTSEKLSSFDSKTKIYFSGKNAPKMTYSYRAKPQINGVTVVGADTIEFSGTKPLTDNKYIAKYKTQYCLLYTSIIRYIFKDKIGGRYV